jgi:hypothetical protein
MNRPTLFLSILLVLPAIQTLSAQTPAPTATPPQTGQRIGAIVSAAIDTAFPVIGKILDLFKPTSKPTDTVTKAAVTQSVDKAQADAKTTMKQRLQPLAGIAKELGVIQAFATAGVAARANIVTINNLLAQPSPNFLKIQTQWTIAKNYLGDVLTITPADLAAVRETSIQARCAAVQTAHKDLFVSIDGSIGEALRRPQVPAATVQDLKTEMQAMSDLLKGFDSLAAIEIATMQDDINSLAKWANSPAGIVNFDTPLKPPDAILLEIVDTAKDTAIKASKKQ